MVLSHCWQVEWEERAEHLEEMEKEKVGEMGRYRN